MQEDAVEFIVNRLEIIDHTNSGTGRDYTKWQGKDFAIGFSQQDDGRTLKIFLADYPNEEQKEMTHEDSVIELTKQTREMNRKLLEVQNKIRLMQGNSEIVEVRIIK